MDNRPMMWELLTDTLNDLREWLRRSGLRPSQVEAPVRKFTQAIILTEDDIRATTHWILNILRPKCMEVKRVYQLIPPEVWRRYEEHVFVNMREQRLLTEAGAEVRRTWKKRPGPLKKSKRYGKPQKTDAEKKEEAKEFRTHRRPVKGHK